VVQERIEAMEKVSVEYGFSLYVIAGNLQRGWALTEQGQGEEVGLTH
jgi:hypothetical protein